MGKLHIGEMTELSTRVKKLEDAEVLKLLHKEETETDSDVIIVSEDNA